MVYPDHAPVFGGKQTVCWSTAIIIGAEGAHSYFYCEKCEKEVVVDSGATKGFDCSICGTRCYAAAYADPEVEGLYRLLDQETSGTLAMHIQTLFDKIGKLQPIKD